MVKLTPGLIVRSSSGYTTKFRNETVDHYLKRLTHVFLEGKSLDDVGDLLTVCESMIVLYLYDNCLTKVPTLPTNTQLSAVYLQNNCIHKMSGLTSAKHLTRLFLTGNKISRVEGLSGLSKLQELYVENQRLPVGDRLEFEPESLHAIANSLRVLDVSVNALTSLEPLSTLSQLQQLTAAGNKLSNMAELVELLGLSWRRLQRLDLSSNEICQQRRYRDRIIVMSASLNSLDGRPISDVERQFLKNWKVMRQPELRLMAPPTESVFVADLQQLSAGTEKASMSSAGGSRQQPSSVVTPRQSTSEPTNAEMSVVPHGTVSAKHPLYYDSSSEMIREGYTPNKVITPSLVRLPGYTLAEFCLNMNCQVERICEDCHAQLVTRRTELCLQTIVIRGSGKVGFSTVLGWPTRTSDLRLFTMDKCLTERPASTLLS